MSAPLFQVEGLKEVSAALVAAPMAVRAAGAKVLRETAEKVADTQRSRTRSSRTRDKIGVRPSKRGSRGGTEPFSVYIGPSYSPEPDANLPWIEEYGTSRQPPHPFIEGSEREHVAGMVAGLQRVLGDFM